MAIKQNLSRRELEENSNTKLNLIKASVGRETTLKSSLKVFTMLFAAVVFCCCRWWEMGKLLKI